MDRRKVHRGGKTTRCGNISKHRRTCNEKGNKPTTCTPNRLLFENEQTNKQNEEFVLIELAYNKKLLVNKFVDLLRLNKQDRIRVGSNILIKTHNQESTTATILVIGKRLSKRVKIEVIIVHFLGSMRRRVKYYCNSA